MKKGVKGKQVWGSTRYFISIDLYTNVFSPSMSGLVSFYDARGLIAEKDCRNLHEIVRTVYDYWSTILAPHQTRVARWLEEYFTEMGIPSDYRLILKLIKTEKVEELKLEDIIEPSKEIDSSPYVSSMKIKEDSSLRVLQTKLKRPTEDEFEVTSIIQKVIDANSLKLEDKIRRGYQFQLGAEDVIQEQEYDIEVGGRIGEYIVVTSIKNTYETDISNVKIADILPFHFKIEDIKTNIGNNYTLKRLKEGIEVSWTVEKLESNESIEIKYVLSRRIKRTILEVVSREIFMIEAYNDIDPHGLDFEANLTYTNTHENTLDYLFIFDEIPPEYKIIRTEPDAIPPIGMIEKPRMKGTIVRWKHKNVKPNDVLKKRYLMDFYPYIVRTITTIKDTNNKEILKCLKFLKILTGEQGYKIMYVFKVLSGFDGIVTLTDKIPKNDVIVNKDPPESQVLVDETGDAKTITWVTDAPEKGKYRKLILYVTGSITPLVGYLSIQLEGLGELKVIEKKTSINRELIPDDIEEKIKAIH